MTTDSADCALSQPSPETSATGALTDIQLWELLPKRLEQNLLAMVQIAAPHHNLRPVDLLQNIAPDFVDYARAVLKAKPQAERPSEKDLYDLAAEFNGDPVPAMRRALELWGNPLQGAPAPGENLATPSAPEAGEVMNNLKPCPFCGSAATLEDHRLLWVARCTSCGACVLGDRAPEPEQEMPSAYWEPFRQSAVDRWNQRATPPAPEKGEVGELHPLWYLVEFLEGHSSFLQRTDPTDELAQILSDSATLLQQQEAELAALRGVPVPVSERLRIVRAGIRAGYNLGHHHTVEGGWGDPDEVADDIAQETLDDIGLPPAPQCLIARMADELDRLQPLPAFPPITSHPLAIEARALLRDGIATIPDPQDGEAGEPVPVAELDDQHREAVHQAVAEALGSGAYDCLRVWEAWGVGTMGPDDFVPVAEDSDRVAEIADAAIEAIQAIPLLPAGEVAVPEPVSECPHCGYEGEMVPVTQAGEVEA
jgi:hypothetical protein